MKICHEVYILFIVSETNIRLFLSFQTLTKIVSIHDQNRASI